MSQSFIEQMIGLRDRVAPLAKEFGNPNVLSLIVRKRENGVFRYLEIKPDPVIEEDFPTREEIQKLSSVEGLTRTYSISGISRKYQEDQLRGIGIDYLIGGRISLGEAVGGVVCNLVSLNRKTLTWDAVLIERIGEQNFYL